MEEEEEISKEHYTTLLEINQKLFEKHKQAFEDFKNKTKEMKEGKCVICNATVQYKFVGERGVWRFCKTCFENNLKAMLKFLLVLKNNINRLENKINKL